MKFTDSHCHIDFDELSVNLAELLTECCASNINRIIVPSVSPRYWQRVLDICHHHQSPCQLSACLGIHPWYLTDLNERHLMQLSDAVSHHKQHIVAIGETGIDGKIAIEQNNLSQQIEFFNFQLALANQYKLPVIIHHRRSHQEIIQQLKQIKMNTGGVIHAFSGSYQQGKTYIDLGFKLGIGSTITYPRAKKTINAVKRFPLDSLVLETDSPAMPLYGHQGKANSPKHLIKVFDCLCQIREESVDVIADTIEHTVDALFTKTKSSTTKPI